MAVPPPQAVLDVLPSEVVLLDARGRILSCNGTWRDFARANGAPGKDWVGTNYLDVCRGAEGGDAARRGILEVLQGQRRRFDLEYPCHAPDMLRWFEMAATRLDGDGGPWVVVAHVDITARHEVEELRRQKWRDGQEIQVAAERARFMRGFVNELAHELGTPLTSVLLRVKALGGALPASGVEAVSALLERLQRTVRGIGTIGDALGAPPASATFGLGDLARAIADLGPEARRRGLRLEVALPELQVRADPRSLHGSVAALATSAAAGCPWGGAMSLSARADGFSVEVELAADAGVRMAGSDADLWLLAGRELARRGGFPLAEAQLAGRVSYRLRVPQAFPRLAAQATAAAAPAAG